MSSGQPRVENGHRPEENQVSSTSGSCVSSVGAGQGASPPRASWATTHAPVGGVPGRDLVAPPELARDAPGLDVLQPVLPGLHPALGHQPQAALAHRLQRLLRHPLTLQNHCVETSGSMGSPLRWLWPTLCSWSSTLTSAPLGLQALDHLRARLEAVEAGEVLARLGGHAPPAVDHLDRRAGRGAGRCRSRAGRGTA